MCRLVDPEPHTVAELMREILETEWEDRIRRITFVAVGYFQGETQRIQGNGNTPEEALTNMRDYMRKALPPTCPACGKPR